MYSSDINLVIGLIALQYPFKHLIPLNLWQEKRSFSSFPQDNDSPPPIPKSVHWKEHKVSSMAALVLTFTGLNLTRSPLPSYSTWPSNHDKISSVMPNRTFCNNENVGYVCCPTSQPLATCDDSALEIWLFNFN